MSKQTYVFVWGELLWEDYSTPTALARERALFIEDVRRELRRLADSPDEELWAAAELYRAQAG